MLFLCHFLAHRAQEETYRDLDHAPWEPFTTQSGTFTRQPRKLFFTGKEISLTFSPSNMSGYKMQFIYIYETIESYVFILYLKNVILVLSYYWVLHCCVFVFQGDYALLCHFINTWLKAETPPLLTHFSTTQESLEQTLESLVNPFRHCETIKKIDVPPVALLKNIFLFSFNLWPNIKTQYGSSKVYGYLQTSHLIDLSCSLTFFLRLQCETLVSVFLS